ncbi:hypothetical protein QYE76_040433 [Lolium multiflorum]|uniref:CCHC-type domain-containing protein n=1 Tax=Lolium multiflorum TaxID=4521 RepID=A0AAD8TBQ1_LOLMU|nr:hypothetical protein QYE76_040433 [Lolium multiflorum]
MRKIWRICGHLDINQLADRKFILEFSEEGDFTHVTKGGPWSNKDDAVLVEEHKEGINPQTLWIPIVDEITNDEDDEVIVFIFYERLLTFCFFCGLIGHKDVDCRRPGNTRRSYDAELGVMPIHRDDPRCWFLPKATG